MSSGIRYSVYRCRKVGERCHPPAPPAPTPAIYNLGRSERLAKNTGKISHSLLVRKTGGLGRATCHYDLPLTKAPMSSSSWSLGD